MPVEGIGGVFFRADDVERLTAWYKEHLGIGGYDAIWQQQAGPTVFAPFKESSDYFAADKRHMLNLRVSDIEGLIESLKSKGVEVETRDEWDDPSYGRFARIHDPEGNPIELWEPTGVHSAGTPEIPHAGQTSGIDAPQWQARIVGAPVSDLPEFGHPGKQTGTAKFALRPGFPEGPQGSN
jgi:predicted enzyme related to lactoylglutathione lyase